MGSMPRPTRRSAWALALLSLVAVSGCASDPTALFPERLAGRWEWRSATGGIAGRTITPATEGYTMEVRFLAGSEAQVYRNGALTRTTSFGIGIGREDGSFPGQEVVRFAEPLFGGWEEMRVELPEPDRLVLADGCCDGFAYDFARIE
jgi:hypothetical protein